MTGDILNLPCGTVPRAHAVLQYVNEIRFHAMMTAMPACVTISHFLDVPPVWSTADCAVASLLNVPIYFRTIFSRMSDRSVKQDFR
jgi:hypothetical protein